MNLIVNKTSSDGSLFQGWGRLGLSREDKTAANQNSVFLSIGSGNNVPNQIDHAKQHGRQTISRIAKKERRLDSKVKLYKERGDRVANRIREIEQDEKNNYRMIKKLAEEYDLDLEGRDYPSYRDLDRVARYIMGFPTSYDDKAMMANIPKLFGAKDEDDLLKRLDYIEHLPSKNGNIRITNEKDMALLKETAMKGDDAINKLYESLIMTDSAVLERLSSYEEYQKKMLPYFLKHYDNELELPSDPEERKKLEELNKGLDYKLKMFRRGVLDISIERLGNHAMSDAVKDSEELFRDATRELIQSVAEDKAETDKEEIEKRTEEIGYAELPVGGMKI